MTRNMVKRVELMFPIFERRIKERISSILDLMLHDSVKARKQANDGTYSYVISNDNSTLNSQLKLFEQAMDVFV